MSTGFLLALSATLLAAGRLNDRYGSRVVLAGGAFAFLLLTAACAAAPTFELLIAARIGQGIAGGIIYTVSLAIVVTAFPPERRAWAIGIYFTSGALGAVIGPVIGGLLTDLGGWRLVFWVQLPLPALVVIGAWLLLPARSGRAVSIDLPGLAAAATFMVAATFGTLQLAVPGAEGVALVAAVVAIIALALFVFIERRVAEPAVRLSIFGNPRFVTATAAGTATWFAIMSSVTFAALYLQLGRGLSPADAGLLILTGPFVGLVLFPFAGRFVGRIGVDAATLLGLIILMTAAIGMLTWNASTPLWLVVAVLMINGLGISTTLVASADDAMAQFSPAEAGTGSALFNSVRQLGAAMGVAIPAVAFEALAGGSRTPEAALSGSAAAFAVRVVVIALPLLLVVGAMAAPGRSDVRSGDALARLRPPATGDADARERAAIVSANWAHGHTWSAPCTVRRLRGPRGASLGTTSSRPAVGGLSVCSAECDEDAASGEDRRDQRPDALRRGARQRVHDRPEGEEAGEDPARDGRVDREPVVADEAGRRQDHRQHHRVDDECDDGTRDPQPSRQDTGVLPTPRRGAERRPRRERELERDEDQQQRAGDQADDGHVRRSPSTTSPTTWRASWRARSR